MSIKFFLIQGLEKLIKKNFLFFLKLQVQFISCKKNKKPLSVNSIAVVNTFDTHGGAAKIAYELTSRLRVDYDVQLYVKYKNSNANWINKLVELNYSFIEEVLRRESFERGWIELTGFHGKQLLMDSFYSQTSVVHLHNLHGEFFSPALFNVLFRRKKVIWTLHDESFITGHCSCTFNCNRWKNGCGDCPDLSIYPPVKYDNTKKVLAQKKKWILDIQPIVVCPSSWLANRVKVAYPTLEKIVVIPNGINTEIFKPVDQTQARNKLGLPLNKKIVLFVAEFSTNNPFKGGAIIRNLIADSSFTELVFITVGGDNTSGYMNHITYPYIDKDTDLSLLYAASDVLLYPTQADNLPLVVLESMSCGTPVIASSLGGIPEIIIHNENGMLVENFKKESSFKVALDTFFSLSEEHIMCLKLKARETVCSNFELLQMVEQYTSIYNSKV
jgi:glycosyltransferase involved in cell wall biosynthesis